MRVFFAYARTCFQERSPERAARGEHGVRYLSRRTPSEWNITTLVDVPGVSLRRFPRFPDKYSLYLPKCYNFCLTPELSRVAVNQKNLTMRVSRNKYGAIKRL